MATGDAIAFLRYGESVPAFHPRQRAGELRLENEQALVHDARIDDFMMLLLSVPYLGRITTAAIKPSPITDHSAFAGAHQR
jgi:hypothetical protein